MKIKKNKMVTIDLLVKEVKGDIIEDLKGFIYLHGASEIPEGLEICLEGKEAGDSFAVLLSPEEGYGNYDKSLIEELDKADFMTEDPIEVGAQFEGETEEGTPLIATLIDVTETHVTLDYNHPLVGKTLDISGNVKAVQEPSTEALKTD